MVYTDQGSVPLKGGSILVKGYASQGSILVKGLYWTMVFTGQGSILVNVYSGQESISLEGTYLSAL